VNVLRRLGRGLVLVTMSVTVFFGFGELVARSFNLIDHLNFPRQMYVATDDPDLGYRLRPNIDVEARGVRVVTNEYGMRGPSFSRAPAPGTHRVLALGDSVVFGYLFEQGDTFAVRLQEELIRRDGGTWEVLNGGVEGYNSRNELAFLRLALELSPETVVLVFNLNDYDYEPVLNPLGVLTADHSQRSDSWLAHSEFLLLLRWLLTPQTKIRVPEMQSTNVAGEQPPFGPFDRYASGLRKQYYHHPDDERWPVMVESLRAIAALCRDRGIRLLVAILPDGDQVGVPNPDLTPQRKLRQICTDLALDCLDLQPSFAAAGRARLFINIMHPNVAGQRIMAREVAAHLLDQPS
jgi:hypothetical protein